MNGRCTTVDHGCCRLPMFTYFYYSIDSEIWRWYVVSEGNILLGSFRGWFSLKRSWRGALLAWAPANSTDTWHRNLKYVWKNTATRGAFWINLTHPHTCFFHVFFNFFISFPLRQRKTSTPKVEMCGTRLWICAGGWVHFHQAHQDLFLWPPTVPPMEKLNHRQNPLLGPVLWCEFCKQIPMRQATGEPLVNTSDIFDIGGPGDFATFKMQWFGDRIYTLGCLRMFGIGIPQFMAIQPWEIWAKDTYGWTTTFFWGPDNITYRYSILCWSFLWKKQDQWED